jgi:S-adenosylmethionine:tRNA ribosyltransferase-isomerase
MRTDELDYELPSELIAQEPAQVRSESRLLVLDRATGALTDARFSQVGEFLRPGDCLVLNDTKVLPARFFARRQTGGGLEGLFLGADAMADVWQVMLKGARKIKPGERVRLQDRSGRDYRTAEVLEKKADGVCLLKVDGSTSPDAVLDAIGFPPLPPYIRRDRDPARAEIDRRRYQTVYARASGAVAAPTAGLHFTDELLRQLGDQGVRFAYVTLHVGAGTFKPIAVEQVEQHEIHHEWYRLDEANAGIINAARASGRRIVAVGTTAVRVLETLADSEQVKPGTGTTNLFILPGYTFKIVDAMITNFHLPRSTLLALVAAFAGLDNIRVAYRHAIEHHYRFYSYGDAMLIAAMCHS